MREIVEGGNAALQRDMAEVRWARSEDAWDAITWLVARDPLVGTALTESGKTRAYTFEGARSIDMPTITIIYEISNPAITVHDALFTEAKHGQVGRS